MNFGNCSYASIVSGGRLETASFQLRTGRLSGIVSCDSAAIRIRIRIARCQRAVKRQKHKSCKTQDSFFFAILRQETVLKVPKRGQFHAAIRVTRNAAIRVPKLC